MSPSTESAYIHWTVEFILHFGGNRNPMDMGGAEVTEFLSWMATEKKCAASTQNQAFNALIFLYARVLEKPLENIKAERARREPKLPEFLTKEECVALFDKLQGDNKLMAQLAYGTGLRLMELMRLRLKDLDFTNGLLSVYQGKGKKNRIVPLPKSLSARLHAQLAKAKAIHDGDLAAGFGAVFLPDNLAAKYPKAPKELRWQYLWPARSVSTDKRTGFTGRHHAFETGFQAALRKAGVDAGLTKHVHPHMLRHSCFTHLLEMGRSLREIQERAGHKDVRTTMIYLHCVEMRNAPSPVDCLCSH